MLSRIAESLFWIGRYVERAEDTARITDVTYHSTLGMGTSVEQEARRRELTTDELRRRMGRGRRSE